VGGVPRVQARVRVDDVRRRAQRCAGTAVARAPLSGVQLATYVHLLDGDLREPLDPFDAQRTVWRDLETERTSLDDTERQPTGHPAWRWIE
jgi:hypothetical protein